MADNWSEIRVQDACTTLRSKRRKLLAREFGIRGRFPIVDQGQEAIAGWSDDDSLVVSDELPLIVFGDHTRIFKYIDRPFIVGADGTQLLKPNKEIDPLFFYFACRNIDVPSRGYNRHFTILKEKKIRYPDLALQRKIATVLWKIQQAIEVETNLIRVTRELKAAVMKKLFTEGLKGEPQKETENGMVPQSWDLLPLGEYCEVENSSISYTDFSSLEHDGASDSSVQAMGIKVSDMNLAGNEKYFITANLLRTVNLELAQRRLVPERTVVFPKRGAAIATNKKRLTTAWTVLDPNLIGVRPIKGLDPEFLFYWFENFDLRTITEPGPTPQLNKKNLVPLKIAAPQQLEQQRDIATIISKLDSSVSQHSQKADRLTELFNEVLRLLMSGKISVADLELALSLCHELVGVAV